MIKSEINNDFYDELGTGWFEDDTHAVALLRQESLIKIDYVKSVLAHCGVTKDARILDVGCGGGFVSLSLAEAGFEVKGVDISPNTIAVAKRYGANEARATFEVGDALQLREGDESADVVMLLDILEHVKNYGGTIDEARRVLKPGGLLFFHTFNRTFLGWLLAAEGIKFIVRDCPPRLHVAHMFIKPEELKQRLGEAGFAQQGVTGIRLDFASRAFVRALLTRRISKELRFKYTNSLGVGYIGYARKV
jgi:2-polyprenyl-6-hydroxyphenyl methylase / 3-demethylubiquinone-9 3-methyltransferase